MNRRRVTRAKSNVPVQKPPDLQEAAGSEQHSPKLPRTASYHRPTRDAAAMTAAFALSWHALPQLASNIARSQPRLHLMTRHLHIAYTTADPLNPPATFQLGRNSMLTQYAQPN